MFSSAFRQFARRFPSGMRAFGSLSMPVAKTAVFAVAGLSMGASLAVMQESYSSGQAIGEGLKAEIWKAKHPQSNVLDMESEAIQLLLTHVRDAECTALPNDEEAEITTTSGHKFQGLKLEDDVKLLAVYVKPDGSDAAFLEKAISDCFREADVTGISVRNGRIVKEDISRDAGEEYSNALVVSPSVGNADAEIAIINALAKKGFKEDDIVLATVVASLDGINKFNKECKEVQVVAATVDPHVSSSGEVIPGIGNIFARYNAALTEPETRADSDDGDDNKSAAAATPAASTPEPAQKQQSSSGGWGAWWGQAK